jgi:hypothetical protein
MHKSSGARVVDNSTRRYDLIRTHVLAAYVCVAQITRMRAQRAENRKCRCLSRPTPSHQQRTFLSPPSTRFSSRRKCPCMRLCGRERERHGSLACATVSGCSGLFDEHACAYAGRKQHGASAYTCLVAWHSTSVCASLSVYLWPCIRVPPCMPAAYARSHNTSSSRLYVLLSTCVVLVHVH